MMSERIEHPALAKNLVLVGGRGCGKTSIAKRLARVNRNFTLFSLDALIRYEAQGTSIADIVAREGWPGFRARELAVIEKVSALAGGALIDAGGGAVVEIGRDGEEQYSERKVAALRRHGRVVYLRREVGYLERRIGANPGRPALSSEESFRAIMKRRDPWYRRAADFVLECGERPKAELAGAVLAWFYRDLGIDAPAR